MNILDYINEHKSEKTWDSHELHGFPNALLETAKVAEFGASKYAKDIWVMVANDIERYTDAKMRHSLYKVVAIVDESGLLHAAWNALAVLELYLRQKMYRASI